MTSRRPAWIASAWLLAVTALGGAAPAQTSPAQTSPAQTSPALASPPPRRDTVRELHSLGPLETVVGDPKADPVGPGDDPRFAVAISYGAHTDSDALLVWRDRRLLLAHDYPGHGPDARTWSASMEKTLIALLVGIAIDHGSITSVDQPAATWLPEWRDDARAKITLRDLMTMSSGLEHPLFGSPKAAPLIMGPDMTPALLALGVAEPPERTFDYNTSDAEIMMIVLERATGRRFGALLSEGLWKPLGLADAQLAVDHPGGLPRPTIFARARDWLAIGELIDGEGAWRGRRVVSAAWIRAMTTPSALNPNYGFFTWLGSPPVEARTYGPFVTFKARHSAPYAAKDIVYLDGYGGERVYVVPSRGLVIVRTGATRDDWDDAILPNAVLAGLEARP
jgi:CubicO group peptidase (beta-lactamase class C family)